MKDTHSVEDKRADAFCRARSKWYGNSYGVQPTDYPAPKDLQKEELAKRGGYIIVVVLVAGFAAGLLLGLML